MTDYKHNGHAEQARRLKAAYLMDTLFAHGASPDDALALDAPGRRAIEKAAGTRKASDETWALVVSLMREEIAHRAHRVAL